MKKSLLFVATLLLGTMAFAASEKMIIDITADAIAAKYGWENGTNYPTVTLDPNITLRVDKNTQGTTESGFYYTGTSKGDYRIYQARVDSFWLEASNDALIDSVALTYTNSNDGTWSTKRGSSLSNEYTIKSGTQIYVGGVSKVCLYMGTTSTKTNGQLRINNFRVVYRGTKQKETPSVLFAQSVVKKNVNAQPFTNELTNSSDGAVTFESSDKGVATVDDKGEVTIVGEGETTITVSVAETDNFVAGSASYVVKVYPENWNIETFTGAGTESTSYATSASYSVNPSEATGLKWGVLFGFIGKNSGNMEGDGAVIRQRKSNESDRECGYLESMVPIEGGIDSLAFQWNSNGSESGNWNIKVYINDDCVGTITEAAGAIKTRDKITPFCVGNLKKEGAFTLRIVNAADPAGDNSNHQRFVVDNIEWFSYGDPTPTTLPSVQKQLKAQKIMRNGQLYILRDAKTYNAQGIEL